MQLNRPPRVSPLRRKLGAAACVLLASTLPAAGQATEGGNATQIDASLLLYGEASRVKVTEPQVRITRLFQNGQTLSAQLGVDAVTGASPTGELPSGVVSTEVQTRTTPSGQVVVIPPPAPDQVPTASFKDTRVALDAEWMRPFGSLTTTLGGHASHEKDYRSLGANGKLSLDLMRKLTTITVGGGYNRDQVDPVGGTRVGLSDGTELLTTDPDLKQVTTALAGVSRVLTRRWLVGVTGTRALERGYLTEPYKVLTLMEPDSGLSVGTVTEKRPTTRRRGSIQANSVYHLSRDVLYASYRYYRDDWSVTSHTIDARYRHEMGGEVYVEPHLRYYAQTAADFYRSGLIEGEPLPEYATSDYRLGKLETVTVGGTLGFHISNAPGEWTLRGEYIGQLGTAYPNDVVGVKTQYDLFHPLNVGSLVLGYTVRY